MRNLLFTALLMIFQFGLFAQKTYVYFENSTQLDFSVSSVQTGTHTLDPSEWWYSTAPVSAWQDETNVLWTNRDGGIHWGDDFFLTTTLVSSAFSIDLKLQLHGDFVGSTIWSAASGPGFSHGWTSDNNFHSEIFTVNGTQYELKYTFYFTGGYDDILFTLHEYDAFSADATELSDPDVMNVLAYNTYMLTPPIALSDQGTRAQHIDEAVHNLDALLIQEVFDNSARSTLMSQLAAEYPYQTSVVDLPNILEDGGIVIVSRWPIEYEAQMVWSNCNEPDCLANKGVKYARINKLGKRYHLFSTHQQAFNGTDDVAVRHQQMQQFNAFIDAQNIPADEAVIFGGDMNVDKYTNKQGEYDNMFSIFNASEPEYYGHDYTWDKYTNHYIDAGAEAPEYLDYVLADNDYLVPEEQSNTVWIMRSNHNDMWNIHDLSDHHAVHGRFVYPVSVDPCEGVTVTATAVPTDESYAGAGDGSVDLTVGGGTSPYTFSWSNGASTEDIAGLTPGTYSVDVADANGCPATASAEVGSPVGCSPAIASFPADPLIHTGGGSGVTTLIFPAGSQDVSFSVNEINEKTGGKAGRRYVEQVVVSYVDGNGATQIYGTYNGSAVTSAQVSIIGEVQSVSVSLSDVYTGSTESDMSVSFGPVDYCSSVPSCPDADGDGVCDAEDACPGMNDNLIGTPCDDGDVCTANDVYDSNCGCSGTLADSDGDGVCDAEDICPGGDDLADADNDGIPDACDTGDCVEVTDVFPADPLTYGGGSATSTTLTLPAGRSDVSFDIADIDAKTNGKGTDRYIERVTVSYVDGSGNSHTYGTFDGTGTASVSIGGPVLSVTITLEDGYDGNPPFTLSVDPGPVTSCGSSARVALAPVSSDLRLAYVEIYPNPATDRLNIRAEGSYTVSVFSASGQQMSPAVRMDGESYSIDVSGWSAGIYFLQTIDASGALETHKFIKP